MRTFITFICLIISIQFVQGQSLDDDNGMFGYKLGEDASTMKDLVPDGKKERLGRKRPLRDSLRHEGILTQKVRLYFYEGKLHSIDVKLQGQEADRMLKHLKARYGEGIAEDAMGFKFRWEGANVTLFWDQNLVSHDAMLSWRDESIHKKYYKFMQSLN